MGKFRLLNSDISADNSRPSSLHASGGLCSGGRLLCLASKTPFAESEGEGAEWGAPLQFPVKVRTALGILYSSIITCKQCSLDQRKLTPQLPYCREGWQDTQTCKKSLPHPGMQCFSEADRNFKCLGLSGCNISQASVHLQYRDLSHDTQLAITIWETAEGHERRALGGTTLRLFSKKGRLKTGRQVLKLWLGREADLSNPTGTPAKVPLTARGEMG